jgi:hypothetical protein
MNDQAVSSRAERMAALDAKRGRVDPFPVSTPDYYRATVRMNTIGPPQRPVELRYIKFVVDVVVEPPIERADEQTYRERGGYTSHLVQDISRLTSNESLMQIGLNTSDPEGAMWAAERAIDGLNTARAYRQEMEKQAQTPRW